MVRKISFERAWQMRERWAYPGDMSPKREQYTMDKIEASMRSGYFEPIVVDKKDFNQGFLTDGKHRLIVAKKLGIKNIPIEVKK